MTRNWRRTAETVDRSGAEWQQIFTDAWRLERDYFYDPNLHGVDWKAMRERYGELLKDAVTRWDLNYMIGELIAGTERLAHYRSGGDEKAASDRGVGYLGCDFALENGAYRIKKIIDGGGVGRRSAFAVARAGDRREGRRLSARGQRARRWTANWNRTRRSRGWPTSRRC